MRRIPTWALWLIVVTSALLLAGRILAMTVLGRGPEWIDTALAAAGLIVFGPLLWRRAKERR